MLQVYGRYVASDRMVSGAYKTEYSDADELSKVMARVEVGGLEHTDTACHCTMWKLH